MRSSTRSLPVLRRGCHVCLILTQFLTPFLARPMRAADPTNNAVAVTAINELGLELLRTSSKSNSNALLSPYSIQNALAMTWSGADGNTFAEMKKVLHY